MSLQKLKGPVAAALTPQFRDGSINAPGLLRHCEWLLDNGCNGVALFGTTGEAECFSNEERMAALEFLVGRGLDPASIIVGSGRSAVSDSITLTRHAVELGVAGLLVLPPFYYNNPTEEGVFRSYAELIERSAVTPFNLYLYHFPEMSGVPVTHSLIDRLRKEYPDFIAGLKDSTGIFQDTVAFAAIGEGFDVFTGDDHLLGPILGKGGAGSITATANIAPHLLRLVFDGWSAQTSEALKAHAMLEVIWLKGLLEYPVTEALKEYLAMSTDDQDWLNMRPPLTRLSEAQRHAMAATFRESGFEMLPSQKDTLGKAVS